MPTRFFILITIFLLYGLSGFSTPVELRNIVVIDGLQENPLLGYGIVVGLKGSGDSDNGSQTRELLSRIANNFGFKISPDKLKAKNSAIVLVSGTLSPFSQPGSKIDLRVSSIYDAKSLDGGELIITPLVSGDNDIYAIGQGPLITDKTLKGVIASIPQGGIVQKQIDHTIIDTNNEITLILQDTLGFGAVQKVSDSLSQKYPDSVKNIKNNRITIQIPDGTAPYQFIADLQKIQVDVIEEPSVLIDSKSGILISGGSVVISEAAISYNGTKLSVGSASTAAASWGGSGTTASGQNSQGNVQYMKAAVSVQDLVDGLNQIGASGSDIIKILQMLYRNGNLKGKLVVQ